MVAQRHEFFGFISSVTDHEALVSGSNVELIFFEVNRLSDIGALFIDGDDDDGGFVIHTNVNGVVADFFNGLSGNLFEVDFGLSADFTEDHADAVFDGTFAGDFGFGVLGETGVKDGVGDVVTEFVGVSAGDVL